MEQDTEETVNKLKKILEVIWLRGNEAHKLFKEGNFKEAEDFLNKRWHAFLNFRAFFHKNQNCLQPWICDSSLGADLWLKVSQQDKLLLSQLRSIQQQTRINLTKSHDYLRAIKHFKTGPQANKFIKLA